MTTPLIATYLRTRKPVNHEVPRSQYKIPLPENYGAPVTHIDEPSPTDQVAYGKYLVTFGHCVCSAIPRRVKISPLT